MLEPNSRLIKIQLLRSDLVLCVREDRRKGKRKERMEKGERKRKIERDRVRKHIGKDKRQWRSMEV